MGQVMWQIKRYIILQGSTGSEDFFQWSEFEEKHPPLETPKEKLLPEPGRAKDQKNRNTSSASERKKATSKNIEYVSPSALLKLYSN
jgi:hypothetical protein